MAPDANANVQQQPEGKCCGVVAEAREKSTARRAKPQPWIVLKLTIFIAIGIIGYVFYVYVGRVCVPMLRHDAGALGGRGMGVGFLVVFCVLGLMMLWAYEKVVLTSPGYARDHVRKSPAPMIKNAFPTWWDSESEADLAAARMQAPQSLPGPSEPKPNGGHPRSHSSRASDIKSNGHVHGSTKSKRKVSQNGHAPPGDEELGITDTIAPVAAVRAKVTARPEHGSEHTASSPTLRPEQPQNEPRPLPGTQGEPKPMMFTRKPPSTPILLPEYRYCHKDGFQKPMRAHHCRACGTCVLKYDHHCPWIGQCVGARNHKFFMIFVWWALLFCVWTFSTLVGLIARATVVRPSFQIDGQHVAVLVLSGLFILFTAALLGTHIELICMAQSTVESLDARRIGEREDRVLGRLHAWWDFRCASFHYLIPRTYALPESASGPVLTNDDSGKRATRRQWNAEWGRIGKEGNPWWLGSARANWEATMGAHAWEWFLPIGKSPDDGLSYTLNPRFDSEGRWRPRREWPHKLQ
ncbi:DHHC palmitoyltransferase-domain-containing protein [Trametes gibbosa]|nr:DHHC palmitoyltransferase-domain-containing protein [Trametes gibbosa]